MAELGTPRRVAFDSAQSRRSVFAALADARAEFGGAKIALVDGDERTLPMTRLSLPVLRWAPH